MELTHKKDLENLDKDLLIREGNLMFNAIKEAHRQLVLIKEVADSRGGIAEVDDMVERSDREFLKTAIYLLVKLDEVIEDRLPDWRSSADIIAEVGDFYKQVEEDDELAEQLK